MITYEKKPQRNPQEHGATLTVVNQEIYHQLQKILEKAFGLAGM